MKQFRTRRGERGQAITELLISLLAIAAVLLGVIMVSVMGISGIKNIIETRTEAERKMTANAFGTVQPQHITEWINIRRSGGGTEAQFIKNTQGDGIQFTQDDEAVTAQASDGSVFADELNSTDGTFSTSHLASTTYARNAFEPKLELSNIFISAADLTSARKTINDPLSEYDLSAVTRALRRFGINAQNFKIEDTVFMPRSNVDESQEGANP